MKRPWQIWMLFTLGLAIVLPAMGWLTLKTLELDRAEAAARRQSEQQERISSALWQMDWSLTPLVAQEAARPYYVYQSFYPAPAGKGTKATPQQIPSPLLVQPSEYVLLHFQLDGEGLWTSPQNPTGLLEKTAVQNGVQLSNIETSGNLLKQLQKAVDREQLLAMLPERSLPAVNISPFPWAANTTLNFNGDSLASNNRAEVNTLGLPQVAQQLEQVQEGQQAAPPQQQTRRPQNNEPATPFQQAPNPSPQNANDDDQSSVRQQFLRSGNDFQKRNRAVQNYGLSQIAQQRAGNKPYLKPQPSLFTEGVSRPLWLGSNLLLARRVWQGDRIVIQGCWLDWEKIKPMLIAEVTDLLPNVDLVPVTAESNVKLSHQLANLPIQIVLPESSAAITAFSSIKLSLIVAWGCLLLATGAAAILLQGVVTLSERRGAFVSAVTHELRTPLTTFRMYAEMLAGGMVRDEDKQQQYLDTLRIESDRLAHLVENVLAYARLERGKPGKRREKIAVTDLLDRVQSRLQDRATQAEMQLLVEVDQAASQCTANTDPGAVEQVLFNLVDNACKYAAATEDRRIHLEISTTDATVDFCVRDHGPGISDRAAAKLFRPFSKSVHEAADTAPGVGLGLALSRRLATALRGSLTLEKANGQGAAFVLRLPVA